MKVLGIHDGHNASAALLDGGRVVAALQEERLTRRKNEFAFPARAIRWVLESTDTRPDDLDGVAVASRHIPYPWTREELLRQYADSQGFLRLSRDLLKVTPAALLRPYLRKRRRSLRERALEAAGLPLERVTWVDHHTAHAAAAYLAGPYGQEDVLVMTADGEGDGICASIRIGSGGRLGSPIATVGYEHSLGGIYSMITYIMGMVPLEHEYKVMGLAPYCRSEPADRGFAAFRDLLRFDDADGLTWKRGPGVPHVFHSVKYFRRLVRELRFDAVAAGLQRFTEEHLSSWVRNAVGATGIRRVALGGGVFMNVKANMCIREMSEVDDVFVFPSCTDDTNSIGAALLVTNTTDPSITTGQGIGDMYWGPDIAENIDRAVARAEELGFQVEAPSDVDAEVVGLLEGGEIVARAAGRMEFGARALGNRSILADPTHPGVVRTINEMVKSRDFWMPFAPAMLAERAGEYVHNPRNVDAPYMIMAFETTEARRDFPAAIHPYDETARPQFVRSEHNPGFHRLLRLFAERTGRAVLLNTSFNLHGFPIVSSGEDALHVFENCDLRWLALGPYLIRKTT